MARTCETCRHPMRLAIERRIQAGESPESISIDFDIQPKLGFQSITRHRVNGHVTKAIVLASTVATVAHGDDLVAEIKLLKVDAARMKATAEKDQDIKTALLAIATQSRLIELQGKVLAEIREQAEADAPDQGETRWARYRVALMDTLAPFPDARLAVSEALRRLDVGA